MERGAVHAWNSRAQSLQHGELSAVGGHRMESFCNEVSVSMQQHREVPLNLRDKRQDEAPRSGKKQSTAL